MTGLSLIDISHIAIMTVFSVSVAINVALSLICYSQRIEIKGCNELIDRFRQETCLSIWRDLWCTAD